MANNIIIVFRHLEDARMRLDKIIHLYDESAAANAFDRAFESQEETPS